MIIDLVVTHIKATFTPKRDFSAFVADATKEEKERILKRAAKQAIKEQREIIELALKNA